MPNYNFCQNFVQSPTKIPLILSNASKTKRLQRLYLQFLDSVPNQFEKGSRRVGKVHRRCYNRGHVFSLTCQACSYHPARALVAWTTLFTASWHLSRNTILHTPAQRTGTRTRQRRIRGSGVLLQVPLALGSSWFFDRIGSRHSCSRKSNDSNHCAKDPSRNRMLARPGAPEPGDLEIEATEHRLLRHGPRGFGRESAADLSHSR